MKPLPFAFLVGAAISAQAQSAKFVGEYEVVQFQNGKAMDNAKMAPGQVRSAELRSNGTWQMRDFHMAFEGKWAFKNGKLELVTISGPSGKLTKPETFTLQPSPDRAKLVVVEPKPMAGTLQLRWHPNFRRELSARIKTMMDKATASRPGG